MITVAQRPMIGPTSHFISSGVQHSLRHLSTALAKPVNLPYVTKSELYLN